LEVLKTPQISLTMPLLCTIIMVAEKKMHVFKSTFIFYSVFVSVTIGYMCCGGPPMLLLGPC